MSAGKRKSKSSVSRASIVNGKMMVIKHNDTFGVFDRFGNIEKSAMEAQGIYHNNTRFLSMMEFSINDEKPLYLSSALDADNEVLNVHLTNPCLLPDPEINNDKGMLYMHATKFLWEKVFYHRVAFFNYGRETLSFSISFSFDADYRDIFEIRGMHREKRGKLLIPECRERELCMLYEGLDGILRRTRIRFDQRPDELQNKQALFKLSVDPGRQMLIGFDIAFEENEDKPKPLDYDLAIDKVKDTEKSLTRAFRITTDNEDFNDWLDRSRADLDMMVTTTRFGPYPYAGVPWYSTAFGRDAIITSRECLWIDPGLARGVLNYLARTQATEVDEFSEAEPGKIFHEMRDGEMANLREVPFGRYYGTIDATPLFICLAGDYYERTGDLGTVKKLWPHIERALQWMDHYGDLDGDGYLEYMKKTENGLSNQGWKDSEDSVFYEDGRLAKPPIALCEVQGFAYEAKMAASMLAEALGYDAVARELGEQAQKLREKFSKDFWSHERQTFVIALDGDKQPCDVATSNAGQCLYAGIAEPAHAAKVAKALMSKKMFSGWGVRTVAEGEARYNPMSYHNGSVWPHDNALIAYGLSRYGYTEYAVKITEGIFNASKYMDQQRLPELFCGFARQKNQNPVEYPVACSPQSWAVGSVYLLIQAFLGMKVDGRKNKVCFRNPALPDSLNELVIQNLHLDNSTVSIRIRRKPGNRLEIRAIDNDGGIKVEVKRRKEERDEAEKRPKRERNKSGLKRNEKFRS